MTQFSLNNSRKDFPLYSNLVLYAYPHEGFCEVLGMQIASAHTGLSAGTSTHVRKEKVGKMSPSSFRTQNSHSPYILKGGVLT